MSVKLHYDEVTGRVLGAYPDFNQYAQIPEPYIEVTETEHDDWMQNQLTRKIDIKTKKIVEYTPSAPSAEVVKQQKITALDAEYQPQFAELSQALGMATLGENADLIMSTKADYAKLKAEYETKRGEIDG